MIEIGSTMPETSAKLQRKRECDKIPLRVASDPAAYPQRAANCLSYRHVNVREGWP
jgi:hypothetical protein